MSSTLEESISGSQKCPDATRRYASPHLTLEPRDDSLEPSLILGRELGNLRGVDVEDRNCEAAYSYVRAAHARGEVATGLLYIDQGSPDMHEVNGSIDGALTSVPYEELCPGNAKLQALMEEYR